MAQRRVLVGMAVAGVVVVASTVGGCGLAPSRYSDDAEVGQVVRSVRLATAVGAVRLRAGDVTTVHRDVSHAADKPGATHRVEGDVLILTGCGVRDCWVDYDVVVPEGVSVSGEVDSGSVDMEGASAVNLRASSGDVTVRRVSGTVNLVSDSGRVELTDVRENVSVEADSGDVLVRDVGGDVTLRASSGRVEAQGVRGSVDVAASSGDVVVATTEPGNVRVHADSGEVRLSVPQGRYRVTAETDGGEVDNGVGDDPAAPNHLDLSASSGDVSVRFG